MATGGNAFKRWYEKNKQALAEKRKARYRNDPEYRAKALENRKKQIARTPKVRDALPESYKYNLVGMSEKLNVSIWRLRDWRGKDYFPEPYKHGRELWFTDHQALLLGDLGKFFQNHNGRITKTNEDELQELVGFIAVNW
jgi:hypothetical protein